MAHRAITRTIAPIIDPDAITQTFAFAGPGDARLPFNGAITIGNKQSTVLRLPTPHKITVTNTGAGTGTLQIQGEDLRNKVITESFDNTQLSFTTTNYFQSIYNISIIDGGSPAITVGLDGQASSVFFSSPSVNMNEVFKPGQFVEVAPGSSFDWDILHTGRDLQDSSIDLADIFEFPHEFLSGKSATDPPEEFDSNYEHKSSFHRIRITNFVSGSLIYTYHL